MRVLVVEDEPRMAALICQGLEEETYAVDVIDTGAEVLAWVETYPYDLLLLDVMLPGMNGFEVCREVRRKGYELPILMLTARDAIPDRVMGLDSGADDYLVKPFAIEELTARLRALTRRNSPQKTTELIVDDLVLDTVTKRARRGAILIELSAKEYTLLETLMRHPRQVLTRDQIIEHVWDSHFMAESKLIEVYIYALRKKIDDPFPMKLIQTIRGLGYRIG